MHFLFYFCFLFSFSISIFATVTTPPAVPTTQVTTNTQADMMIGEAKLKVTPETQNLAKSQLIDLAFKEIINKEIHSMNGDAVTFWKHYQNTFSETQSPPFVQSYLIKSFSRSPSEPDLMFLSLEAKVDHALFANLYQQVLTKALEKRSRRYYLKVDYELVNCIWSDLGVVAREDFTKVVEEHWLKWLRENDEHLKNIELWQNSSAPDSMIINIVLKIKKDFYESKIVPGMNLEYAGAVKLLSGNDKIITGYKIDSQNQFYSTAIKTGLSSTIANYVYRLPLPVIGKLKNEFGSAQNLEHSQAISLHQFSSLDQVFSFLDLIKDKGSVLRIFPELERINANEALVNLKYTGDELQLGQILKTLNHQSFKQSPQNPYEFYFQVLHQNHDLKPEVKTN